MKSKRTIQAAASVVLLALVSCGGGDDNKSAGSGSGAPAAPSDLTATPLAGPGVHVTWKDQSADEEAFVLERKMEGEQFSVLATPVFNETSYHDASVMATMTYTYRIAAKNAKGQSAYSNEVTAAVP